MKKLFLALLIVLLTLTALTVTGASLYRHFVTSQIADLGGMENPDAGQEAAAQSNP